MEYKKLFSPLKINSLTIKNRIGLSPMSMSRLGFDRGYTDETIAFYERRAMGGAGLITLGECNIDETGGKSHDQMLVVNYSNPGAFTGLARAAEAVHRHGAAISIELNHGGPLASPQFNGGVLPMGPVAYTRADGVQVRAMTRDDMDRVADEFADAAEILRDAGFDMVQVHLGHFWLLHQFLSPHFNTRDDEFGGTVENRARFPLMVLDRVRGRVGARFPIDMRISAMENVPGGYDIDETVKFAKLLAEKADIVNVSCGGNVREANQRMVTDVFHERGCNVPLAEAVKKAVDIPVSAIGGLCYPAQIEELLENGSADMVFMGRALIADPDLPKKILDGRENEISHCLKCLACGDTLYSMSKRMKCSVNPALVYGDKKPEKAEVQKRVLVVGGGPAGMEAALTASKRGHRVVLLEKTGRLGGALSFADAVDFKKDVREQRERMAAWVRQDANIELRLNTCATPELVRELNCDEVLIAAGAEPVILPMPGVNGANVITGKALYEEEKTLSGDVVIIGGGMIGCETALYLMDQGCRVTVIELLPYILDMRPGTNDSHAQRVYDLMQERGVRVLTGTKCLSIDENGVNAEKDGETMLCRADTVVLSVGMRPDTALADALTEQGCVRVRKIGDCLKPGKILTAIRDGYDAALDI